MRLRQVLERFVQALFFQTDTRLYWREETFGIASEAFRIQREDRSAISGKFLYAGSDASDGTRGVILYAGAPAKNLSFNLPQILWLANAGFIVAGFDWPGAGESTGTLSLNGMAHVVKGVLTQTQSRFPNAKILLFGQGPGADAALRVAQNEPSIKGLILEPLYASPAGWLIDRYGPGIGHAAAVFLPEQSTDPVTVLPTLAIPTALFCPAYDDFVPAAQTARVIKALPKGSLCVRADCGGYASLFSLPGSHREALLSFCQSALDT